MRTAGSGENSPPSTLSASLSQPQCSSAPSVPESSMRACAGRPRSRGLGGTEIRYRGLARARQSSIPRGHVRMRRGAASIAAARRGRNSLRRNLLCRSRPIPEFRSWTVRIPVPRVGLCPAVIGNVPSTWMTTTSRDLCAIAGSRRPGALARDPGIPIADARPGGGGPLDLAHRARVFQRRHRLPRCVARDGTAIAQNPEQVPGSAELALDHDQAVELLHEREGGSRGEGSGW